MLVSVFDFDLPPELIAQRPPEQRGSSRMLRIDRRSGAVADLAFVDLPSQLQAGDLLVLNDSRVLPARLFATRAGLQTQPKSARPQGHVEVLLTKRLAAAAPGQRWQALVRPAKKVPVGETLLFAGHPGEEPLLRAEVVAAGEFGERTLDFTPAESFFAALDRIGHLPLPPYIRRGREQPNTAEDRDRYQTVYAQGVGAGDAGSGGGLGGGSAAAPTAGLHFTPEILAQLAARGVETARITLHVGLGTFQPVRVERTEEIRLHEEPYSLNGAAAEALNRAHRDGRRVVAVGTTVTRTLEHLARRFEAECGALSPANPLQLQPHTGATGLFLSPGPDGDDRFRLVSGLLTNFHLPSSTLLMLVSAFAGRERVLSAYAHAVRERYRFFSYGDCMLIL